MRQFKLFLILLVSAALIGCAGGPMKTRKLTSDEISAMAATGKAAQKITDLTAMGTAPATDDEVPIVDISDTAMASTGTTKKVTVSNFLAALQAGYAMDFSALTIVWDPTEVDDVTWGASTDTSKRWTFDVGETSNPYFNVDKDYFEFSLPVKAPGFVSNAADGEHYIDIGNTSGYTGSSTPSNGWLNYNSSSGRYEYYDGDWNQYLWTSVLMSSWAGSSNLTTLGTVWIGTWQASAVGLSYGGTGATDAPSARSNLGLTIGTDVQAYDSDLGSLASGVTGLVKGAGDSGGYSAATDGTDYWSPTSLPQASGSQDGYLVSGDWTTFNNKQNALTAGDALSMTGDTINFDGGATPGGELGGTWASPTIADGVIDEANMTTAAASKLNRYHQTAHFDPDNQYANYDGVVVLDTYTAAALTVSAIRVYLNEAPTNEVSFTVYQEAAAVGYASGTVIGSGTTSSGIATVTSFTDNTVPAGSKIWVDVTSDPDSTTTGFEIVVEGTYD